MNITIKTNAIYLLNETVVINEVINMNTIFLFTTRPKVRFSWKGKNINLNISAGIRVDNTRQYLGIRIILKLIDSNMSVRLLTILGKNYVLFIQG